MRFFMSYSLIFMLLVRLIEIQPSCVCFACISFSHYWWYHLQRKHSVLWSWVKWLSQAGVCFWAQRGRVCARACVHMHVCFSEQRESPELNALFLMFSLGCGLVRREITNRLTQTHNTHSKTYTESGCSGGMFLRLMTPRSWLYTISKLNLLKPQIMLFYSLFLCILSALLFNLHISLH